MLQGTMARRSRPSRAAAANKQEPLDRPGVGV